MGSRDMPTYRSWSRLLIPEAVAGISLPGTLRVSGVNNSSDSRYSLATEPEIGAVVAVSVE
jgi:hypothetical protein